MSTASLMGQIMGGGRLYRDAPLAGYTEEEMVAEAKQRMGHNRQRRRLKQLLSAASNDGSTVATKDLLLAAKLAKMELPEEMVADTPYAAGLDGVGVPTAVAWKPFYSNLPPPALKGPGGFGDLPPLRKNIKVAASAGSADDPDSPKVKSTAQHQADEKADAELTKWFKIMQDKMTTRFSELRRAFRTLDEDASGELSHDEFKEVMAMFNLGIPDHIMNRLINLADFDGDGSINYAEFARIFTTENVLSMKKTLQAIETDGFGAKIRYEAQHGGKQQLDKETKSNVRLRSTGPGLEKMRKAHRTLRNLLLERYGDMKQCFKEIDADGSGMIRRNELRTFLRKISKSIPDNVISGLISYVDTDGDTKTLSKAEFLKMMSEEFLDDVNTEEAWKKHATTHHNSTFRDQTTNLKDYGQKKEYLLADVKKTKINRGR